MSRIRQLIRILPFALLLLFAGCGHPEKRTVQRDAEGAIEIDFWHSMGGPIGDALADVVRKFNASQNKIRVVPVFQGTYDDCLAKIKQVGATSQAPSLVQVFECGTCYMVQSGIVRPIQEFVDRDKFDLGSFEKHVLGYYRIGGTLYSMPFNVSTAIVYYNKDMFTRAGLDPERPPNTFGEIKEASRRIVESSGPQSQTRGFGFFVYSWFIEQLIANQGALLIDNDNGRSAPAEKSLLNAEPGLRVFEWIRDLQQEKLLIPYSRNSEDARSAFFAQKLGMLIESSALISMILKESRFQVGTTFLPIADGVTSHGALIGGASLYILKNAPVEEQEACWEFIKFMVRPEVQAEWSAKTGYLPVSKEAHSQPLLKDLYVKKPQFWTPVEQLHRSQLIPATQGAFMGIFPWTRESIQSALERMYGGASPKKVLDRAAADMTEALAEYRMANRPRK